MNRAIRWLVENAVIAGLAVYAFSSEQYSTYAQYALIGWIWFSVVMTGILVFGNWVVELAYKHTQKVDYVTGIFYRARKVGPAVAKPLYIGMEVAYAALFFSMGWWWTAIAQTFVVTTLLYIFDDELTLKELNVVYERFKHHSKELDKQMAQADQKKIQ